MVDYLSNALRCWGPGQLESCIPSSYYLAALSSYCQSSSPAFGDYPLLGCLEEGRVEP